MHYFIWPTQVCGNVSGLSGLVSAVQQMTQMILVGIALYFFVGLAINLAQAQLSTATGDPSGYAHALQQAIILNELRNAGLASTDQQLPASVRLKHGIGRDGRNLHYYLNYSSQPATITYTSMAGTDLLTGRSIAQGAQATIGPWDLIIVKEKAVR